MNEEQKKRAARYVAKAMLAKAWDPARLAVESGLDAGTVATFLGSKTWPWPGKRAAMEEALGLQEGSIELAANGLVVEEDPMDPVEKAIRESELDRANQNKLVGTYYEMLDGQEGRRSG